MRGMMPLIVAWWALLADASDGSQVQAVPTAPVPNYEVTLLHQEHPVMVQNTLSPKQGGGRRTSPLLMVALLAVTAAVAFLVLQCFSAIKSSRKWSDVAGNMRRLAEGYSYPCSVGFASRNWILIPCRDLYPDSLTAGGVMHAYRLSSNPYAKGYRRNST